MAGLLDKTKTILLQLLLIGILCGVAFPVSFAAVLVGRGSVEHFVVTVVPALLGVPLIALLGIIIWLFAWRIEERNIRRRMQWTAAALIGIGLFFLLLVPSYLPGILLNYRDVRGARFYCESLIPRLESYREAHGTYPAVVDSLLTPERPLPQLLKGKQFYRRVGADYEFSFLDPSPIWGGHSYFSSIVRPRGKWERW